MPSSLPFSVPHCGRRIDIRDSCTAPARYSSSSGTCSTPHPRAQPMRTAAAGSLRRLLLWGQMGSDGLGGSAAHGAGCAPCLVYTPCIHTSLQIQFTCLEPCVKGFSRETDTARRWHVGNKRVCGGSDASRAVRGGCDGTDSLGMVREHGLRDARSKAGAFVASLVSGHGTFVTYAAQRYLLLCVDLACTSTSTTASTSPLFSL
ncbi:hypothetical protein BJ912DRAFT_117476 [Pholiota molesta]|nr:hypothetical protein BJ912DRAFT_117476 [Pholiota molesta]